MPWKTSDVDGFKKGLTAKQKREWVAIANIVLQRCQDEGGEDCEAKAVKQANGVTGKESKLGEAGRVLSKANEGKLRSALESLTAVLSLLDEEDEPESEPEGEPDLNEAAIVPSTLALRAAGEGVNLDTEFVPLVERAVRGDGTLPVKLISAGWGSSGYYPAEVLRRDGPQVFKASTQMFWDHPTPSEEAERPEGSLKNLAGELVSDARWQESGSAGPGLYADAKVFGSYRAALDELAPHIGVSIRALGRATHGEAEGRKGPIIQALTAARTVDFVTQAGAGGKVIEMFEAARTTRHDEASKESHVNEQQSQEAVTRLEQQNQALTQRNAWLEEAMRLRDARDFVRDKLATASVPAVTRARLGETLSANLPITDGALDRDAYAATIDEAVKSEVAYLTQAAGYGAGRVEGMGASSAQANNEASRAALVESFKRLGLDEKAALVAAEGR